MGAVGCCWLTAGTKRKKCYVGIEEKSPSFKNRLSPGIRTDSQSSWGGKAVPLLRNHATSLRRDWGMIHVEKADAGLKGAWGLGRETRPFD